MKKKNEMVFMVLGATIEAGTLRMPSGTGIRFRRSWRSNLGKCLGTAIDWRTCTWAILSAIIYPRVSKLMLILSVFQLCGRRFVEYLMKTKWTDEAFINSIPQTKLLYHNKRLPTNTSHENTNSFCDILNNGIANALQHTSTNTISSE